MRTRRWWLFIGVAVAGVGVVVIRTGDRDRKGDHGGVEDRPRQKRSDVEERVVGIALRAVENWTIPDRQDLEVTVGPDGTYSVTWPVRQREPALGPDYHARVEVDPESGTVIRVWMGN